MVIKHQRKDMHKNDPGFILSKSIVPINHQAAVAEKRKKEDSTLCENEDTEEVMEVQNFSDNSSSGNVSPVQVATTQFGSKCPIQSTLNFTSKGNSKQASRVCGDDISVIHNKIDKLLKRMEITPSENMARNEGQSAVLLTGSFIPLFSVLNNLSMADFLSQSSKKTGKYYQVERIISSRTQKQMVS